MLDAVNTIFPASRPLKGVRQSYYLGRFVANPEALFEKLSGLIKSWKEQLVAIGAIEIEPAALGVAILSPIGVPSLIHIPGGNAAMLDTRADKAMYEAKKAGLCCSNKFIAYVSNIYCALKIFPRLVSLRALNL